MVTVEIPNKSYRTVFIPQQIEKYSCDLLDADSQIGPSKIFHGMLKPFKSRNVPKTLFVEVSFTEILRSNDPCTAKFDGAEKKMETLMERGSWKNTCKDEVPHNANYPVGRVFWLLMIGVQKRKF